MTLAEAVVFGLIQGLTEFLPISSIAHMKIVGSFCGWNDPGAAFSAFVQLIAYLAVLWYFRRDIAGIIAETIRGKSQMGWMIIAATVPIAVLGVAFRKHVEHGWRSLYVIAGALIGLGLLLAAAEWTERRRQQRQKKLREMDNLNWRDAIVVGLFQALALVPGASRSGSTITGGLFLGMTRDTAARFSFLLSLPAVFGAGVLELRKLHVASRADAVNLAASSLTALVVGYLAIAFLLGYLRRHTTWVFIVYRLALGAALLALLLTGKLQPF